jgi:hypothetical protein
VNLEIDINRWRAGKGDPTGIYVRARLPVPERGYASIDIWYLTRPSLMEWLRSRGGANEWAENTVAMLLNHDPPSAPRSGEDS